MVTEWPHGPSMFILTYEHSIATGTTFRAMLSMLLQVIDRAKTQSSRALRTRAVDVSLYVHWDSLAILSGH